MTAITPLEFIHKKGLFGEHQKKDENELLRISEVKALTIVQVVQYKNTKSEIKNLKINNLTLSNESSSVVADKETRILWSGPRTWLVISSKEEITDIIKSNFSSENFAVTNISHSRAVIQIQGSNTREVLKKGCPLNINDIKKNNCAGSVYHGITIMIDCINDKPDTFNLFVLRSFGESFYHHITDAALEFGYTGV